MTTAERPETVVFGNCPACGGPVQFTEDGPAGHPPEVVAHHVPLPNVDEDLGRGWKLVEISDVGRTASAERRWRARGRAVGLGLKFAYGPDPSAAYLALREAIEARP